VHTDALMLSHGPVAYAVGLAAADAAVTFFQEGQPALLYLVPCTLGAVRSHPTCQLFSAHGSYGAHPTQASIISTGVTLTAGAAALCCRRHATAAVLVTVLLLYQMMPPDHRSSDIPWRVWMGVGKTV
jgi:hypothetical protein